MLNVPSELEVTGSINKPVSLSAGEYTIKVDDIATTNESPTNFCFSFKDADGTIGDVRVPYTSKARSFNLTRAATTVAIYSDNDWGSSQSVTTTYKNLMISAGTEDKDYEAHGASPSTDYPSTIRNCGDNINQYDKDNANILNTPIDSNGLGINAGDSYKTVYISCKPNTTYTISKKFDETKNRFAVAYSNTEPNYSMLVEGYISKATEKAITIKTGSNAKYLLAYVWITGGSTTYQEMLDSIKIEEGEKPTPYSNHGCGNVNFRVCNKNINTAEMELGGFNYITGALANSTSEIRSKQPVYLSKAKEIIISTNMAGTFAWFFYKKDKETIIAGNYKNNSNSAEIEVPDDAEYIMYRFSSADLNLPIQIEENNVATEFEEHQEQSISFPMQNGQVLRQGDYPAEDGTHHVRKKVEFDGTENWFTFILNDYQWFGLNLVGIKIYSEFICTHLKNYSEIGNYIGISNNRTANRIYLSISEEITTVEQLKSYLAQQKENGTPVVVEYDLAEEEIVPYNEAQQTAYNKMKELETYRNVTNVFCTDETSCEFDTEYYKDLATMFTNQNQLILQGGN